MSSPRELKTITSSPQEHDQAITIPAGSTHTLSKRAMPVLPSTEFRFSSADGLNIACARWDGHGSVHGVVQIAHGMGEHIGRYSDTIAALVSVGLTVYGSDHRGHGRTALSPTHFGDFGTGGFDLLVEDMFQLSRMA